MADDDPGILGALQGEEPWALEETQNTIKKNWETYLKKHAKKDTKSLQDIAKNIDTLVNGTSTDKTTLNELKRARTANEKDSEVFNKLLGTMQKGNVKRNKNFKDLKQSVSESILKGNKQSRGMFSGMFGGFLDKFTGVVKGVINFDGTMGGLAKTIGGVSAVVGGMIAWVANTTETYKSLVNVGQTFGGRMFDMNHAANRAGISLDLMAKMTIKHSKLMAFQTSAGVSGLKLQLDTQLAVRKNIRAFGNYGLTLEQVNDFSATYLDQLRIQGRLDKMSNDSRILATTNYMRKLSELSEITGKARDELAKEMKEANENVNQWALAQQRTGADRENFLKAMENVNLGIGMFSKDMQGALQQIVLQAVQFSGNIAMTDVGGAIASLVPTIGDAFEEMATAVANNKPEDIAEANAALLTSVKNLTQAEIKMLNILAPTDKQAEFILKLSQQGAALRIDADGRIAKATTDRSAAEEEAAAKLALATEDAAQKATRAAMNFSDVSSEVMGQTKDLILTAFEKPLNNMVGHMGDAVAGIRDLVMDNKEFLTTMANKINNVGDSMTKDLGSLGTTVGVAAAAIVGATVAKGVGVRSGFRRSGLSAAQISEKVGAGKAAGRTATSVGSSAMGLGKTAMRFGGASISGALVLKDMYDIGSSVAKGENIKTEDVGGVSGGIAGGIIGAVLGGPPGAVIGIAIGNWIGETIGTAMDESDLQREQSEAGARPKPGSPEANRAEQEAAGGRWVTTGRGRKKWVPDEGGLEAGPGEEAVAGGMSSEELLTKLNEHMQTNNELLAGIGNATGATATNTKKTNDALGGFNSNNLQ